MRRSTSCSIGSAGGGPHLMSRTSGSGNCTKGGGDVLPAGGVPERDGGGGELPLRRPPDREAPRARGAEPGRPVGGAGVREGVPLVRRARGRSGEDVRLLPGTARALTVQNSRSPRAEERDHVEEQEDQRDAHHEGNDT